jgi:dTMP kinase
MVMQDTKKVWKKFVVLEGLDGAGTTTQKEALTKALVMRGEKVFSTCEPTDGPVGRFLRQGLKGDYPLEAGTFANLFAADRYEHLFNETDGIQKQIGSGSIVICDRYLFSSLAYQSLDYPFERIMALNEHFPLPEFLFFLDIKPSIAGKRLKDRSEREIFENEETQNRVFDGYKKALAHFSDSPMEMVRIDATLPREKITEIILNKMFPV